MTTSLGEQTKMEKPARSPRPYILLFESRSGSSYLTDVLAAHGEITALGEKFKTTSRDGRRQLIKMRDFLSRASGISSVSPSVIGFKTKRKDIVDPSGLASLLKELDTRVICLTRRNRIKQTVSRFNAVRLHNSTGSWNLYRDKDRLSSFTIDPTEFSKKLHDIEIARMELLDYVVGLELPTLMIQYEDLLRNGQETIDMVFAFLGVTGKPTDNTSLKNTSDDLRSVLDNFSELKHHFEGTAYEAMFDEITSMPDRDRVTTQRQEPEDRDSDPSRSDLTQIARRT